MATTETIYREPIQISQGDTISFTKRLALYKASDGWSLLYAMRGGAQQIEFTSTPSGDDHVILVSSATTEAWLPAEYVLEGWAVNTDTTRKQIYLSPLLVTQDLSTAQGGAPVTTHAQRMLTSIEQQLEKLAQNALADTTVEGTRILREQRLNLLQLRNRYKQERKGEIARSRAKSGQPTGRKIKSYFNITAPGAIGVRNLGAGSSVFNDAYPE